MGLSMKKFIVFLLPILLVLSFFPIPQVLAEEFDSNSTNQEVTANVGVNDAVYDIYVTLGTLPTLYAGLNTFTTDNKSYMWYARTGTLDPTYLPKNVELYYPTFGIDEVIYKFIDKVKELYESNPNAKFNLYTDDLRVQFMLQMFTANKVPESSYKVHLLSDGTATYVHFRELFKDKDTYSLWKQIAENYEDIYNRISAGEENVIKMGGDYIEMYKSMYYASQKNNVEYWMQFPELLTSDDPEITNEVLKMNTVKKSPLDIYNSLSAEKKLAFIRAVGVDKALFDSLFNASDKPNLIISGTSLGGEKNSFETVVKQIVADYGNEFDLFFKPHPIWDPITNDQLKSLHRKEFLEDLGIKILPAQLPMEALMWAYPDVKIGGYSSTLYMSTAKEQSIFFIADSKDSLTAPLPELYDLGYFGNAKFYKISADSNADQENTDATISKINVISNGTNLDLTVTESVYTANVANNVDKLQLLIIPSNNNATVIVQKDNEQIEGSSTNGVFQTNYIPLQVGKNEIIIKVVAADGKTSITYSLIINREETSDSGSVFFGGGSSTSPPTSTSIIIEPGVSVSKNLGEEVVLYIPKGTFDQETTLRIEKLAGSGQSIPTDRALLSHVYELTKDTSESANQPFKLTLAFDKTKLGPNQVPSIFYYDEKNKEWIALDGSVEGDKISADVSLFTKYAVLGVKKDSLTGNENPSSETLIDITGHWAEEKINEAYAKGIISGYPDNTFRPDQTVSREEFAVMLDSALHLAGDGATLSFSDQEKIGEWAKPAVARMITAGILEGYEDGTFKPNSQLNRTEMTVMIMRALNMSIQSGVASSSYTDDAEIPFWAKGYIAAATSQGIINGRDGKRFAPNELATRAEAIVMILRALDYQNNTK
jgi:hypothetical protein